MIRRLLLAALLALLPTLAAATCPSSTTSNLGLYICDDGDPDWNVGFLRVNFNKLDFAFSSPLSRSGTTVSLGTVPVSKGGLGLTTFVTGDLIYSNASNSLAALSGNTTTTRKFLRQTGNGSVSAAPAWDTLQAGDLPSGFVDSLADLSSGLCSDGQGPVKVSGAWTCATGGVSSGTAGFLRDGGATSLSCGSGAQGKAQVMDNGDLQYCDGASTSVLQTITPGGGGAGETWYFGSTGNGTVDNSGANNFFPLSGIGLNSNGSYVGVNPPAGTFTNLACDAGSGAGVGATWSFYLDDSSGTPLTCTISGGSADHCEDNSGDSISNGLGAGAGGIEIRFLAVATAGTPTQGIFKCRAKFTPS